VSRKHKRPPRCTPSVVIHPQGSAADDEPRAIVTVARSRQGVPIDIVKRQMGHFYKADPEYGIGVVTRMGLSASDLPAAQAAE
jgi:catalase